MSIGKRQILFDCFDAGIDMRYARLRDLREDSDLTQEQLVRLLDMHKTTYTNYEQGKREIPFALAIRLAELYNVSLDYLAGLESRPTRLDMNRPFLWEVNADKKKDS